MSSPTCPKQSGQGQYVKQRDSDTAVYQPLDEALLTTMINSASQKQLAHLLQNLCSRSKTAAKLAQSQLLALQKEQEQEAPNSVPPLRSILKKTSALDRNSRSGLSTTTEPSESLFAPVSAIEHATFASEPGPNKRKAMSHCRNCGREYTLAASAEDSCTHHPGKREVNEDHEVWNEFDPDVLGDAWTLMEYERFASGFRWSCCKRGVAKSGCVVGIHTAAPEGGWKKKVKVEER